MTMPGGLMEVSSRPSGRSSNKCCDYLFEASLFKSIRIHVRMVRRYPWAR